jgi:hypothetical protein
VRLSPPLTEIQTQAKLFAADFVCFVCFVVLLKPNHELHETHEQKKALIHRNTIPDFREPTLFVFAKLGHDLDKQLALLFLRNVTAILQDH